MSSSSTAHSAWSTLAADTILAILVYIERESELPVFLQACKQFSREITNERISRYLFLRYMGREGCTPRILEELLLAPDSRWSERWRALRDTENGWAYTR